MSSDLAVSARRLGKSYRAYQSPFGRPRDLLFPGHGGKYRDFWALRGVSFDLPRGEALGVIGSNGSGKSTLLHLLCGVLQPSEGEVRVNGRISALLGLGTGFNTNFTGRENVYINGALSGLTRTDIDKRFKAVADFADIDDFIDRPVKTYSSGMYLRLAFAAAVHTEPDILIIDEALAVGDFAFRQKCAQKINELREKSTVILVSHNMRDILLHCTRGILLQRSQVLCCGTAQQAVDRYIDLVEKRPQARTVPEPEPAQSENLPTAIYGDFCIQTDKIRDVEAEWVDSEATRVQSATHGTPLVLRFRFRLLERPVKLAIGVPLWNQDGILVTAFNSDLKQRTLTIAADGTVKGELLIPHLSFNPGAYTAVLAIVDGREYLYRNPCGRFSVIGLPFHHGLVTLKHRWRFEGQASSGGSCSAGLEP